MNYLKEIALAASPNPEAINKVNKRFDRIEEVEAKFKKLQLEEKELLMNLFDTLESVLKRHSDLYHIKHEHTIFAGDLVDPPHVEEVITGTEYPFTDCAFDYDDTDKAFNALCDNLEQQYFEV